jgi:hypothetical protein
MFQYFIFTQTLNERGLVNVCGYSSCGGRDRNEWGYSSCGERHGNERDYSSCGGRDVMNGTTVRVGDGTE